MAVLTNHMFAYRTLILGRSVPSFIRPIDRKVVVVVDYYSTSLGANSLGVNAVCIQSRNVRSVLAVGK